MQLAARSRSCWALLLALGVGCTHDYDEFSFSGNGGSGGGGGGGGSGGDAGASAGSAGSAGAGGSGGTGGTAANQAGKVTCAAANDCATNANYCCAASSGSACVPSTDACAATRVRCDGPEDCGGAQVCCADFSAMQIECRHQNDCGAAQGRFVVCGDKPGVCAGGTSCKSAPALAQYSVCSPS